MAPSSSENPSSTHARLSTDILVAYARLSTDFLVAYTRLSTGRRIACARVSTGIPVDLPDSVLACVRIRVGAQQTQY
eukprot:3244584-Rhodomonas_salina.2